MNIKKKWCYVCKLKKPKTEFYDRDAKCKKCKHATASYKAVQNVNEKQKEHARMYLNKGEIKDYQQDDQKEILFKNLMNDHMNFRKKNGRKNKRSRKRIVSNNK